MLSTGETFINKFIVIDPRTAFKRRSFFSINISIELIIHHISNLSRIYMHQNPLTFQDLFLSQAN